MRKEGRNVHCLISDQSYSFWFYISPKLEKNIIYYKRVIVFVLNVSVTMNTLITCINVCGILSIYIQHYDINSYENEFCTNNLRISLNFHPLEASRHSGKFSLQFGYVNVQFTTKKTN